MKKMTGFKKVVTTTLASALLMTAVLTINPAEVFAATTGVVNTSALNMRSGASLGSSILGVLKRGTTVDIVETAGEWYKVTALVNGSSKSGYVHSNYIKKSQESGQGSMSPASGTGVVNVNVLNVRAEASTQSSKLGAIYAGTKVKILAENNEWYKVNVTLKGKNVTAYVFKSYITIKADNGNQESDNVSKYDATGYVNVSGLNVRSSASLSSSIKACLKKNTTVKIIGKSGDWYQVETTYKGKNITGFVSAKYITLKSDTSSDNDNNNGGQSDVDTENYTKAKVNVNGLNLRSNPSTSSRVVTVLYRGTILTITGETNGWYRVTTTANGKNVSGYVAAQHVRKISDAEADSGETIINATAEDEYLLACLVDCEARNQSYEGQLAVANVVLNRVKSPKFPDTIKEVIYQKNQFTPAFSGSLARVLKNGPTERAKVAAHDALAGKNNVEGYYFFNGYVDTSKVTGYIVIGDHTFYYY